MSFNKELTDTVNEKFALVSEDIDQYGSPGLADNSGRRRALWSELRESCTASGTSPVDVWLLMVSSKVIPGILELLKKAIDRDTKGDLSDCAAHFTVVCALFSIEVLDQNAIARSFHHKIAHLAPEAISTWWKKFRYLKAIWIQEGRLTRLGMGFLRLFRIAASDAHSAGSTDYPGRSLSAYPDSHDFIMFAAISLDYDGENASDLLFAMSCAASGGLSQTRLGDLPSVNEYLQSQPLALSGRLVELLQVANEPERFENVIRAAFNLSTSHLKFLKQGTLAHALADSIWKMLAIAPRGPEKDRTTYNALMLISQLMEDRTRTNNANDRAEIARLLSGCDLLSFIEKVMMIQTTTLPHEPLDKWKPIIKLLTYNPDALRSPLRRDFLRMLRYLRTVKTTQGQFLLDMWLQLGAAAKISEAELKEEVERERKAARGGLVGCSWYKCAMYEQESAKDTFMCAGCLKATYCGPNCQDRDWDEGGHKAKCKARVMTALATR